MSTTSTCPGCGKEFAHRADRKTPFCSHSCAAKTNYKPRDKSFATCHPDKPLVGKGLCKSCYYKKYFKEKPDKRQTAILSSRGGYLRREYGITEEQWEKTFQLQNGKCPICLHSIHRPYNPEGKRGAAVDHDHKTKRNRGLVCHHCNRHRIGTNTPDTAKRLLAYISSDFDMGAI